MKAFFMNRYQKLLGPQFKGLDTWEQNTLPSVIRANTLKIDEKELVNRLQKKGMNLIKIDFLEHGYRTKAKFSIASTQEFLQGYYYPQEAAAQIPAQVLDPQPGEFVLDGSAAPGGKLTQMSQIMKNTGVVIGIDIKDKRLEVLRNNIERMGVTNTIIYKKDLRAVEDFNIKFDKIMLDAPCSGNFTTDPNWFEKRTLEDIKKSGEVQKKLLKASLEVLKDGGILVYATCSLEPEEDELIIDWLLKNFDVQLEEINLGSPGFTKVFDQELSEEMQKTRRFWPHIHNTQGFFIAKIRKLR